MTRGQGGGFTRAFHLWNQCDAHSPQIDRTGYPYQRQVDALAAFFRTSGNPALPLIFAGDFNIGKALSRQVAMRLRAGKWWAAPEPMLACGSLRECMDWQLKRVSNLTDAQIALRRAKHW